MSWHHIKKEKRQEDLARDLYEVSFPGRFIIQWKLAAYFFSRPIRSFFTARYLRRRISGDVLNFIDRFLWGDGGFYRAYAYSSCDHFEKLQGSRLLVAGAGYGGNILQLAAFRPAEIVAFDPVSFPEEWAQVSDEAKRRFGVPVRFITGTFDAVSRKFGLFDAVLSDAVLMYVKNPRDFIKSSYEFLKPGGLFYASVGFPWFGPRGDTLPWRGKEIYNHLLLDGSAYEARAREVLGALPDSSQEYFISLLAEKPFSFFRIEEYFSSLADAGFIKESVFIQIDPDAVSLLEGEESIARALDDRRVPRLDRYARGVAVWMRK